MKLENVFSRLIKALCIVLTTDQSSNSMPMLDDGNVNLLAGNLFTLYQSYIINIFM